MFRCLEALSKLLPTDLPELASCSPNFDLKREDSFTIVDGTTNQVLGVTTGKSQAGNTRAVFANRLKIREVLTTQITVQYSKQFMRYEEDRDGITAYFKDGTSARGHILVGADGANSPVRSQLLSGFRPDPSPFLCALAKVILTRDLYQPLLEHSSNGPLVAAPNQKAYCLLMEYLGDGLATFNWNVCWRSASLEEDYARMLAAGPAAQLETVRQRMKGWPPAIVKAIELTEAVDVQWPPVRLFETVLPPYGLPKGRVTLIGDAAHSMVCTFVVPATTSLTIPFTQVPFRGMGANTAILDACDLGVNLITGIRAEDDLHWVLQTYERAMIPRGRLKALESRETANSDDAQEISGGRVLNGEPVSEIDVAGLKGE